MITHASSSVNNATAKPLQERLGFSFAFIRAHLRLAVFGCGLSALGFDEPNLISNMKKSNPTFAYFPACVCRALC